MRGATLVSIFEGVDEARPLDGANRQDVAMLFAALKDLQLWLGFGAGQRGRDVYTDTLRTERRAIFRRAPGRRGDEHTA